MDSLKLAHVSHKNFAKLLELIKKNIIVNFNSLHYLADVGHLINVLKVKLSRLLMFSNLKRINLASYA